MLFDIEVRKSMKLVRLDSNQVFLTFLRKKLPLQKTVRCLSEDSTRNCNFQKLRHNIQKEPSTEGVII